MDVVYEDDGSVNITETLRAADEREKQLYKFVCPLCHCHEIEETTPCAAIVRVLNIDEDTGEAYHDTEYELLDETTPTYCCLDCGYKLEFKDGSPVARLEDVKEWLKEQKETESV